MYIEQIKFKDGIEFKPTLFNVIIGGNAVGKTTLILEIDSCVRGANRTRWYWIDINSLKYSSNNIQDDMSLLIGSIVRHWEGGNLFYYSQATKKDDGNVDLDGNLRFTASDIEGLKSGEPPSTIEILNNVKFRRPFVSLLDCESRLNLPQEATLIRVDQPPQDPLNVLFRNKRLLKRISQAIKNQFALELNLLDHKVTIADLGLSDSTPPTFDRDAEDIQSEYERLEAWKAENFTPIKEIGHGIRSMLRILLSLFEPVNQVLLIDEPEMHLYPSQKRWLGTQLRRLAREQRKQAFVVTHDPIVLQGILDSPGETTIIRLEKDGEGNYLIKLCTLDNITDIGAIRNQDSYLQGLFYQRCIAVEGASDRAFYQTMIETYPEVTDKDLGLVACGGKGSTKHLAHIAKHVGLRCAFIYDFDALLTDIAVIGKVFKMFGGDGSKLSDLKSLLASFGTSKTLKNHPKIKETKKHGLDSCLVKENKRLFNKVIRELSTKGIFIVPGGSLESWAPDIEEKARFADIAPDKILKRKRLKSKFDRFMKPVLNYLGC